MRNYMTICLESDLDTKIELLGRFNMEEDLPTFEVGKYLVEVNPSLVGASEAFAVVLCMTVGDVNSELYFNEHLAKLNIPKKEVFVFANTGTLETCNTKHIDDRTVHFFEGRFDSFLQYLCEVAESRKKLHGRTEFIDSMVQPDTRVDLTLSLEEYEKYGWFEQARQLFVEVFLGGNPPDYVSKLLLPLFEGSKSEVRIQYEVQPFEISQTQCSYRLFEHVITQHTGYFRKEMALRELASKYLNDEVEALSIEDPQSGRKKQFREQFGINAVQSDLKGFGVYPSRFEHKLYHEGILKPRGLMSKFDAYDFFDAYSKQHQQSTEFRAPRFSEVAMLMYGSKDRLLHTLDIHEDKEFSLRDTLLHASKYFSISEYRSFLKKSAENFSIISGRPSPDLMYGLQDQFAEWIHEDLIKDGALAQSSEVYREWGDVDIEKDMNTKKLVTVAKAMAVLETFKLFSDKPNIDSQIRQNSKNSVRTRQNGGGAGMLLNISNGLLNSGRDGLIYGGALIGGFQEQRTLLNHISDLNGALKLDWTLINNVLFYPISRPGPNRPVGAARLTRDLK